MSDSNSKSLEGELGELKTSINGRVKVMENVGEIWRVVNVYPNDVPVTVKFHLLENYPQSHCEILVVSSKLSDEQSTELHAKIADKMKSLIIENTANFLLTMYNFILDEISLKIPKTGESKSKKKNRTKSKNVDEKVDEKGATMKTATDVINRILWDNELPIDEFIVGYLDRFIGIVEKSFIAFNWEDIATVDYTALAIPKHRIQYFRYKKVKVWDKNEKLDNVFGSLGGGLTIVDVIRDYKDEDVDNSNIDGEHLTTAEVTVKTSENETESDSDSDDGITVTIGETTPQQIDDNILDDNLDDLQSNSNRTKSNTEEEFWQNKLRPNYFLALRITDVDIRDCAAAVQDHITENDPDYTSCVTSTDLLHITLCTMRLDTESALNEAVSALTNARDELLHILRNTEPLKLSGLDSFHSRVLYAKVEIPSEFTTFLDCIRLCLNECGIPFKDLHDFVPHMTMMKVTRPFCRENASKRKLDPWLYAGFEEIGLGYQKVDCIHLCEMGENRNEDGFYKTHLSLSLVD